MVISVFIVPLFYLYSQGQQYEHVLFSPLLNFMLGNLGGASMFCQSVRIDLGRMNAHCPIDSVFDAKNAVFGLMSNQLNDFTHCHQDSIVKVLQNQTKIEDCTKRIQNMDDVKSDIVKRCQGKQMCLVKLDQLEFD